MKVFYQMVSKIKTLLWFLRRPELYPQMIYMFHQRIFPHPKENTRTEATKWCEQKMVPRSLAIKKLTNLHRFDSFESTFSGFYDEARIRIEKLDVKMGGGADLDLLYYLAESISASKVIETGVAYGWSSSALLFSLKKRPEGMLFSSDMPYPKMNNEDYVGYVIPAELKSHWQLIRLPDRQAVRKLFKEVSEIDMCHYDSDKTYRGRVWAYPKLWSRLKSGGIFVSDDINDNVAFKDFSEQVNVEPTVVYFDSEKKYIGVLVKP